MREVNHKIKSKSKRELASQYGISVQTFSKWIKEIPNLNLKRCQKIFTPKQVELITLHIGEP